jgi:hypothetical protein
MWDRYENREFLQMNFRAILGVDAEKDGVKPCFPSGRGVDVEMANLI